MKMNGFTLAGTTGSTFQGVQTFAAGSIGYRAIPGEREDGFRIRVVPSNGKTLEFGEGWKTPDSDGNRYSTVVTGVDALVQTVAAATRVLAAASIVSTPAVPAQYIPASPARLEIQ